MQRVSPLLVFVVFLLFVLFQTVSHKVTLWTELFQQLGWGQWTWNRLTHFYFIWIEKNCLIWDQTHALPFQAHSLTIGTHLMARGYEPGREDQEFDPKLGDFFLFIIICWCMYDGTHPPLQWLHVVHVGCMKLLFGRFHFMALTLVVSRGLDSFNHLFSLLPVSIVSSCSRQYYVASTWWNKNCWPIAPWQNLVWFGQGLLVKVTIHKWNRKQSIIFSRENG